MHCRGCLASLGVEEMKQLTERDSSLMWALSADQMPLNTIARKFGISAREAREHIYREDRRMSRRRSGTCRKKNSHS